MIALMFKRYKDGEQKGIPQNIHTSTTIYVCISSLLNVLGRKLGVSDKRMDLRHPDREPQTRTPQRPPQSIL